ncbi:tyrosyl-DNA phosphodiesterase-domain-containing protein [Mycena albidolilacea]|uniref:Tyrosyl-DNA phosphodiesterase-domain-containing protein n=1 Tax=Mycena albidolilacea TaxID=1033008 RepID=A0AAD6ZMV8_9AGAR|nr:tyrosyl-DNA phosphodiesterase-domain-containing protein [Mycena albidolilacea]
MRNENETESGAPRNPSLRSTQAKPVDLIVVDDSATEDDSDDENIYPILSSNRAGSSARSAAVLSATPKLQTSEPIVVDDSETEDADAEEIVAKKSAASIPISAGRSAPAPASSVSLGKRKEADLPAATVSAMRNGPLHSLPDRAQMEAERLARRKCVLQDDDESAGDSKRQRVSGATISTTTKTPLASRLFYSGAFFPTMTLPANPRADGREAIRFADITGSTTSSDLKLAIISSFGIQPEWLAPHFNNEVPVIVVTQTGQEGSGPTMTRLFENPNWIQTCPKVGTGGCFHMKYMFLFYKSGRLRVVVSTANLVSLDWEHLENMVFIQDVFLGSSSGVVGNDSESSAGKTKQSTSFATLLETVLKATNVGPALESVRQKTPDLPLKSISDLSKLWDWSGVTAELVPSIAGKYEGWNKIKTTGHPRLMCSLEKLGLATSKTHSLVVECQGSSIGTYTTQWFNQFYISASGHPSVLKAHMELSEGKRKKLEYPRGVKVVFPTVATVRSTGGYGSTSLFCTRKKWEAKSFPRAAFYDSKSSAGKVLMHTKMIIGSFTQKKNATSESSGPAGWMYVGSHNFTAPAWGNLSGSADAPVLNVNNYELGVVVPLMTPEEVNIASAWERPPSKYTADDGPWIQEENR